MVISTTTPLSTPFSGPEHRSKPVLELSGIYKAFPGVKALTDVGLLLFPGEVHTLMGQNGAGKSTLIKILTGVYKPDSGRILLNGRPVQPRSTLEAQNLGISTVYQEVNLCLNLSVAENIFIGRYPMKNGFIDWPTMKQNAQTLLAELQVEIDVTAPLSRYSLAVQQMVAISRALSISAKVLILDEPTSSLDDNEVQMLFTVLRRLREQGLAILFVTHFLEQTFDISDRITVLRNGIREGEYLVNALSRYDLVNKMVGVSTDEALAARTLAARNARDDNLQSLPLPGLSVLSDLSEMTQTSGSNATFMEAAGIGRKGALAPLDITCRSGEVLGLCGLLGSGRTEAARLLFGADKADSGTIAVKGKTHKFNSPRDAIAAGIGFSSENRKEEGAILELSVRENIILALQARAGLMHVIGRKQQQEIANNYIKWLGIKTPSAETPIGKLSGGNQQKALLARWLATDPEMLILDEPTRGVDVRAKQEIMDYVVSLCRKGMAILFISSEIDEVLRCSDRILVLRDRKACGQYLRGELDDASVLQVIAGDTA